MIFLRTLLVAAIALALAGLSAAEPVEITASDVIERAGRVLRTGPDNAATWHAGVAGLDAWPARLEKALLKALGPPALRDVDGARQALVDLLDEQSPELKLGSEARVLLLAMVEMLERQARVMRERDEALEALEQERAAHRATQEKLQALRRVDEQIEERDDNGGR